MAARLSFFFYVYLFIYFILRPPSAVTLFDLPRHLLLSKSAHPKHVPDSTFWELLNDSE